MNRKNTKIWGERENYRKYLYRVIELFPTMFAHIKPERIFLCGFVARSSKHLAKITPNRNPWQIILPEYDYAIQFHDPAFLEASRSMHLMVMAHELFHIPLLGFDKH